MDHLYISLLPNLGVCRCTVIELCVVDAIRHGVMVITSVEEHGSSEVYSSTALHVIAVAFSLPHV